MKKFKVLTTETVQRSYEVRATSQAHAMAITELGAPVETKKRFYKSVC